MMLETTIEEGSYWDCHYMNAVESAYESLFREIGYQ